MQGLPKVAGAIAKRFPKAFSSLSGFLKAANNCMLKFALNSPQPQFFETLLLCHKLLSVKIDRICKFCNIRRCNVKYLNIAVTRAEKNLRTISCHTESTDFTGPQITSSAW
jgi:hypothetical protein